jgi:hypothetical protein
MNHPLRLAILTTLVVPILAGIANAQTPVPPNSTPGNPIAPELTDMPAPSAAPAPSIGNFGSDNPSLRRAMNLARQAAEQANGGLEKYRAEPRMYGLVSQAPVVFNPDGTWTFRFRGSTPGATDLTIETVVTMPPTGAPITIAYNGPIRNPADFPEVAANPNVDDGLAMRRAMNLARQAAERTNGGLEKYRAEAAMYGSTERAPITANPDGTWTFRFRGAPPGVETPTVESVITVSRVGQVTINSNTPLAAPPAPPTPAQPGASPAPETSGDVGVPEMPNPNLSPKQP